ncbi:MAG: hypothetical protein HOP13_11965 [Alphaproteobacteria bacterium]|nr:hypothetical protein [Alphaproteobacteria bacterium]
MDFVFAKGLEAKTLLQGDLLIRNDALKSVLSEAHQYYADAPSYTHFVVVTQSCDLVRRGKKPPKALYITIAAVRSFDIVLRRTLAKFEHEFEARRVGLFDAKQRQEAERFLERMLNNEEKGYFFFRKDSHPSIKEDLCAFLSLSVALRPDHYDALLSAKVAQLDGVFAAKLGSIVAELYSRIATPDINETLAAPEQYKASFYEEKLGSADRWVSTTRWAHARGVLKQDFRGRLQDVGPDEAAATTSGTQDDMGFLADRAAELAKNYLYEALAQKVVLERITGEVQASGEDLPVRLGALFNELAPGLLGREELKNILMNDARLRRIAKGMP